MPLDSQTLSTIGFVSHELRIPLQSTLGFNRYLLDELAGPLTDEQRRFLEGIRTNMTVLTEMVDDLLDVTMIQNGHFGVSPAPVCFPEIARKAVAILTPLAEPRHQTIRVRLDSEHLAVDLDERRILQVLLNLGGNAVKHAGYGAKILIVAYREGDRFVCKVIDDGVGLAPEDQQKLFQPFSRLSTRSRGTGLGLCICKGIVLAHHGQIGVESEPGQGCTFWFSLPVRQAV